MQDPAFVKRAFSDIADSYVLTNHVLSFGTDILWRRKFVRGVKADEPIHVLDVATGSGDVAKEILRQCPDIDVVATDFCQPMLATARKSGLTNLVVADGMQLPFDNAAFDIVTVAFGLRNMACWKDALSEWRRVLKPGGKLHVLDFSQPTWQPFKQIYLFYLHKVLPKIAGLLTGHGSAYDYLSNSINQFPHGRAMCALISEAGFTDVNATPLSGGIAAIYVGLAD